IHSESMVEIPPSPTVDLFGFVIDQSDYIDDQIRRNESLYIILDRYGVSPQQIYEIQQQASDNIDFNRLIPGQDYRIYEKDGEPYAFVWQHNLTEFVTIRWDEENVYVDEGRLPVTFTEDRIAATINTSLYEAVSDMNASQMLGQKLSEIFGWEVDFFSLQSGDHFKAIYDNRYANGEFIGIGDVKAAEFQHKGNIHRAYYFDNGERRGYFDKNGNSLQKDLLKAPFRYSQRISSSFSRNRFHPILKQNRPHFGTDYAAPTGTPVIAVGDGVVIEARRRGGNGNIVQIRHNSTYTTAYLHLNGFASGIRSGVEVKQGDVIGYVGQTGLATGPHLCYRMYQNDRPVNSQRIELPASESLEKEYMGEFLAAVYRIDMMLDEISLSEEQPQNIAMQ
ncbi:MAG: peptidoglycan DD-metalloendopeptidase family protein, partial [Balneolaceae bacterium]|nr:peptidoglycan DD-metalloendopeptidase family protein [Balneolaceae bacterium]